MDYGEVRVFRGEAVESAHRISLALVDSNQRVLAGTGHPEKPVFLRSTAKPLQLLPHVAAGCPEAFSLTDADLALMAASHNGEPVHIEGVQRILDRLGLAPETLQCGLHPPLHQSSAESLVARGEPPTVLHNNCSGKHAGMLALALHRGWPVESYTAPDHPVQQDVRRAIIEWAGSRPEDVITGTDGCSLPAFALPLTGLALAFARMSVGDGPDGQHARRILRAMVRHPYLVAGEGRLDTDLMAATGERLVAKVGGEAIYAVAVLDEGLGLALKVEDGAWRALGPAVVETLRLLNFLPQGSLARLAPHHRPVLTNHRGIEVGRLEAEIPLTRGVG